MATSRSPRADAPPAPPSASQAQAPPLETIDCQLCGESGYEVLYDDLPDRLFWIPGRFAVVRCRSCDLVRTRPRPTRTGIARHYPAQYSPFAPADLERSGVAATLRDLLRVPYRLRYGAPDDVDLPPRTGAALLDVGCGAGLYLAEAAAAGWDVWGIEPNPEVAETAFVRAGAAKERIFVGAAEDAEYEPERFDLIAMSHVLEHLHDPLGVLHKVNSWLRPGGVLRIWIPNFGSVERRVFGRLWLGLDIPRHLTHFTPRTLSVALARTAFDVERIVPQWQGNMLTGSVTYVAEAVRRRRRPYREPRGLHYALLPAASVLLTLGEGGCMTVTARKHARGGHAS